MAARHRYGFASCGHTALATNAYYMGARVKIPSEDADGVVRHREYMFCPKCLAAVQKTIDRRVDSAKIRRG